jgi:hypothetical protein
VSDNAEYVYLLNLNIGKIAFVWNQNSVKWQVIYFEGQRSPYLREKGQISLLHIMHYKIIINCSSFNKENNWTLHSLFRRGITLLLFRWETGTICWADARLWRHRFWSANWLEESIQFLLCFGSLVLRNNNLSQSSEVRVIWLNFRVRWWVDKGDQVIEMR